MKKQKFAADLHACDGPDRRQPGEAAQMDGQPSIGRVMDKLVREKMLSLRQPDFLWQAHYLSRFGRCE